jgi:hypothetical protein
MLTKKQIADRYLWIEALESGKYDQQVKGWVGENGHCCLSVAACEGLTKVKLSNISCDKFKIVEDVKNFAGYTYSDIEEFIRLNDEDGFDFDEISYVIEITIERDCPVSEHTKFSAKRIAKTGGK